MEYQKLPKNTKIRLEKQIFKSAKRNFDDDDTPNNLEDKFFESGRRCRLANRFRQDSDSD